MRRALVSVIAAATMAPASAAATPRRPTNAAGFVTDGSPQNDDGHCVGDETQRVACLVARRPQCIGWTHPMDRPTAWACWAPAINVFDWPRQAMMLTLYCESKGESGVANGAGDVGLLQETAGDGDAVHDLVLGYDRYWISQGPAAWPNTYGRECAA